MAESASDEGVSLREFSNISSPSNMNWESRKILIILKRIGSLHFRCTTRGNYDSVSCFNQLKYKNLSHNVTEFRLSSWRCWSLLVTSCSFEMLRPSKNPQKPWTNPDQVSCTLNMFMLNTFLYSWASQVIEERSAESINKMRSHNSLNIGSLYFNKTKKCCLIYIFLLQFNTYLVFHNI